MTEDEMVGWHHYLDGHEFEQTPGGSGEQDILLCFSSWCNKEYDTTEQLNKHHHHDHLNHMHIYACIV